MGLGGDELCGAGPGGLVVHDGGEVVFGESAGRGGRGAPSGSCGWLG